MLLFKKEAHETLSDQRDADDHSNNRFDLQPFHSHFDHRKLERGAPSPNTVVDS